jgi:hypothetical protein
MSSAQHAHAGAHGAAGHHDDHHDFDNEPARELPADEPRTPAWIPVLGLAIFFLGAVAWLWSSSNGDEDKTSAASDKPAAAAQQQAQPAPQPVPDQGAQPGQARPMPPSIGSGGIRQLSPEQARQIQQQIEAMQRQRAAQGSNNQAPAPQ